MPDTRRGNAQLCLQLTGNGLDVLSHEAGGHRVQRIPPGERNGRVHSSTVTVAVLAQSQGDRKYRLRNPEHFEISFFSGTGPGGQNRNKVQASARIKHLPTGFVRSAQTRSRENSVRLAMEALTLDLDNGAQVDASKVEQGVRKSQVGSGQRGDKRRTYRYQEGRVMDHQTHRSADLSRVLAGGFDPLWP